MQLYIDTIKVKYLINRNNMYSWFMCVDNVVRRVSTYDYEYKHEQFMVSV
jgi:hypothetical protein